jgi:TolA-binding protein
MVTGRNRPFSRQNEQGQRLTVVTGGHSMRAIAGCALVLALVAAPALAAPASAQSTTVTSADLQRLDDSVYNIDREISRLRTTDPQRVSQLQSELDELRDEVVYLRVKLRRERTLARAEYTEVRDKLDDLRGRVRSDLDGTARDTSGQTASGSTRMPPQGGSTSEPRSSTTDRDGERGRRTAGTSGSSVIPVGQELDVRLQDTLSSDRNQVEDRFSATTVVDLDVDGRVVIPAGSELRGVISAVHPAGRVDRKGSMTVSFDQITIDNRTYPLRGTVTQALESEGVKGEVGRIGAGAGVGAIIGGILGGVKGALAGILIGGGGVVAATEGKDVELPAGTLLRVSLDAPPDLR